VSALDVPPAPSTETSTDTRSEHGVEQLPTAHEVKYVSVGFISQSISLSARLLTLLLPHRHLQRQKEERERVAQEREQLLQQRQTQAYGRTHNGMQVRKHVFISTIFIH
jgi:hypothetical protein